MPRRSTRSAVVYFLADVAALPLLLTPVNTASTSSTWVIGGEGIQDANFVYPFAAFIAYMLAYVLYRMPIRLRKARKQQ